MRKIIFVILVTIAFKESTGQTLNEWFKQKKTQKKYLIEQIAALEVYVGFVQKGYRIARKGLTTIDKIKKGDYSLHDQFFHSFQQVNPAISKYSKVADIISFHLKIIQTYRQSAKYVHSKRIYNPAEIDFTYKIFSSLIHASTADINHLIQVLTPNELEIEDDERLNQINSIYARVEDRYAFAKNFADEARLLALQRTKEKNDIETSLSLHGRKK
jgi:hypothetical protein